MTRPNCKGPGCRRKAAKKTSGMGRATCYCSARCRLRAFEKRRGIRVRPKRLHDIPTGLPAGRAQVAGEILAGLGHAGRGSSGPSEFELPRIAMGAF